MIKINDEKLLYWAKQLAYKNLSVHEIVENTEWLIQNAIDDDWNPIETAPKDGTDILLYSKEYDEMGVAYWNFSQKDWILGCVATDFNYYLDFANPSHWKPKPETP